ncbi:MAG: hypothetical protein DRP45_10285, partial [Candidatus Zixiibacteriota bacterium]
MEKYWYKPFFIFLLIFAVAASLMAADRGLKVMSSSREDFHFVADIKADLSGLSRDVRADSSVSYYHTIQVCIPAGADVRLAFSRGRDVAPMISGSAGLVSRVSADQLVTISKPVTVRGRRLVAIRIHPVTSTGVFREVEVHLAFEAKQHSLPLTTANDPRFDRIFSSVIANYETARHWPVIARSYQKNQVSKQSENDLPNADQWYKIGVNRTGIVTVSGAQLEAAGVVLNDLISDSIRIFNAGGLPNPVENY